MLFETCDTGLAAVQHESRSHLRQAITRLPKWRLSLYIEGCAEEKMPRGE